MSRLADRLLVAVSVDEIATALLQETSEYTMESLVAELENRAKRLSESGRPAESRLVRFLIARVSEHRDVIDRAAERRRIIDSGATLEDLLRADEGQRMILEMKIADLARRDKVGEALNLVRQADRLPLKGEDFPHAAAARHFLADALRGLGRSREALDVLLYTSARGFPPGQFRDSPMGKHAAAMFSQMEGLLHDDTGSYERGRFCYETAASSARQAGDDSLEFQALTNLVASYAKSGRRQTAARAFRRLLQRAETKGIPEQTVAALNNVARFSDRATAEGCYQRVLEICAEHGATGPSHILAYFGLGDLAADRGDTDAAVNAYLAGYGLSQRGDASSQDQALEYLGDRLERGDDVTGRLLYVPHIYLLLAETVERGNWQFTVSWALGDARWKNRQGDREGAVKGLRSVLASPEIRARGRGRQDEQRITLDLAGLLALSPTAADRQESFDLLWGLREHVLAIPDAADRATAVRDKRRVYELLIRLLAYPGGGLRLPDTRPPVHLAFDLHEEAKSIPEIGRLPTLSPPTPAGFDQLRRQFQDTTELAFVSYFCGIESTAIFTYVPTADRLIVQLTPIGADRLAKVAARLRRIFNGEPEAFPPLAPLHPRRPWRRDLRFLEELSGPILAFLDQVEDCPLLCVAGDGPILGLPLPALPDKNGKPLALRHAVVNVLSATVLVSRRPSTRTTERSGPVLCAGTAAREDDVPELMERDADMFRASGWDVRELAGISATRDRVLAALSDVRIAHLTCHGYFDSRHRLDAGLLLAHAGTRPSRSPSALPVNVRQDYLLTPKDIASASARLDLVSLRACSAGTHEAESDEEVTGLAQTLLLSSASSVIAPLWDVAEESSRRILSHIYEMLITRPEQPLWRSVWNAQRKMITNPERPWDSHPYHWAALALFGNWS